LKIDKRN
jgi:hypothetical protein